MQQYLPFRYLEMNFLFCKHWSIWFWFGAKTDTNVLQKIEYKLSNFQLFQEFLLLQKVMLKHTQMLELLYAWLRGLL